ncbi:MAG: alginate O-acetyltransferase AlgX-related protein [Oceanidesulfovibrio sp.]
MVLAPDEFQVNDALWARLMSIVEDPSEYDRDYPQKRVAAYCREKGIPHLDLLPLLREAEHKQHTYHIRDTHWNAWGNEVAGKAIADKILEFERRDGAMGENQETNGQ